MEIVNTQQRNKIHPHKLALWIGIGSMIMMFAGLTSAYIVKREQPNWTSFPMPTIFWYSTAAILLSSLTIQMAIQAFKEREMKRYKSLIVVTLVLGLLFIVLQWIGFTKIWEMGLTLKGSGAAQFLYVIAGLHALHVLGGVVVLLVMLYRAFRKKFRVYTPMPSEIAATYWHFVDLLWIYLFVFFLWIQ